MIEPTGKQKGAPDHGSTVPVAKLEHLRQWGDVEQPEPNVAIVRHRSGQVTRWLESMAGWWYRVDNA
jgi:hypothetical protein